MIYTLIVYLLSVFSLGKRNYLGKKELSIIIKVIHVLLTFILFEYYFNNFRILLWDLKRNGFSNYISGYGNVVFNESLDVLIKVLFFFTSFFMAGLSLTIAVKARGRRLFIFSSPLIIFITSLDLYATSIVELGLVKSTKAFLVFSGFVLLIFIIINLFYNLNPGKKIFTHAENVRQKKNSSNSNIIE